MTPVDQELLGWWTGATGFETAERSSALFAATFGRENGNSTTASEAEEETSSNGEMLWSKSELPNKVYHTELAAAHYENCNQSLFRNTIHTTIPT